MSRFAAPIAEQIWDMKYRFKEADGTPIDASVEDTWRRIARSLAEVGGGSSLRLSLRYRLEYRPESAGRGSEVCHADRVRVRLGTWRL